MFKVINGTPPPDTPQQNVRDRLKATKPAEMLQCRRCGGREVIETRTGVLFKNGRVSGGVKAWICAGCHRKGERVVLM